MGQLTDALWWVLERLKEATGNYGIAVILLTVLVRLVLAPLGFTQFKALQVQKKLQPRVQELQRKYKDRPQELQRRLLELYREHRINPLSGCLPVLIQFPVLVGLYRALTRLPQGASFLVWDLSGRDPFFILPALAAFTTYLSMKPTLMDERQAQTMYLMSAVTGFITYTLPSGLGLYWVVSNLFSLAQMWFFQRQLGAYEGGVRTR